VFRAVDTSSGRPVALKVINLPVDPESARAPRQRFLREVQVLERLRHPNVVRVLDHGVLEDGRPVVVMEMVGGETLERRLAEHGPMLPEAVISIALQVTRALERMHQMGIVHRDVKPANIAVEGAHRPLVKLLDFGLVKHMVGGPDVTAIGALIGTPSYMAPEQILGNPIDARTDVYTLGVLLFEMLTGRVPFGGTVRETLSGHLERDMPPIRPRHRVPVWLEVLIRRCLAKEPEDRPAGMSEVLAELLIDTQDLLRIHD